MTCLGKSHVNDGYWHSPQIIKGGGTFETGLTFLRGAQRAREMTDRHLHHLLCGHSSRHMAWRAVHNTRALSRSCCLERERSFDWTFMLLVITFSFFWMSAICVIFWGWNNNCIVALIVSLQTLHISVSRHFSCNAEGLFNKQRWYSDTSMAQSIPSSDHNTFTSVDTKGVGFKLCLSDDPSSLVG